MQKVREKILEETPVFDLVQKEFKDISFKPVGLNCHDWVMMIATDGTKHILVKQTRWGVENETIEFVCGTVEDNETSEHAALREFREETGIILDKEKVRCIGAFSPNPAYFNNKMTVYYCKVDDVEELFSEKGKQLLDADEDCNVIVGSSLDLTPSAMTYAALALLSQAGSRDIDGVALTGTYSLKDGTHVSYEYDSYYDKVRLSIGGKQIIDLGSDVSDALRKAGFDGDILVDLTEGFYKCLVDDYRAITGK